MATQPYFFFLVFVSFGDKQIERKASSHRWGTIISSKMKKKEALVGASAVPVGKVLI